MGRNEQMINFVQFWLVKYHVHIAVRQLDETVCLCVVILTIHIDQNSLLPSQKRIHVCHV